MKTKFLIIACLLLTVAVKAINVVDLRCENEKTPIGVDRLSPRFSWKLTTSGAERGLNQSSYRIQVGKTANASDVWDSGVISKAQQTNILFSGKTLESHTKYYWTVTVTDSQGSVASSTSSFTTGLFNASDWQGRWIKYPVTISANQQIWFRKNITLTEDAGRAIAYVASLGNHELYVNGQKVDDRVLAPCLTSYTDRILYVGYDVTSLLKKGQNTVAIWYAPGWTRYQGAAYAHIVNVQMEVTYASGTTASFSSNTEWKCKAANGISSAQCQYEHHGGEIIDATTYDPTWNTTACTEDATWLNAGVGTTALTLTAQLMPATKKIGDPIVGNLNNLTPNSTNLRLFMGKNYTGWTEVKLTGMTKGAVIKVNFCDDNSYITQWDQILTYTCSGVNGEVACNHFNFNGGGYITLEGVAKENIVSITGYSLGNDLARTGFFKCSDDLINQIYETDLYTYRSCTTEGYTSDCPHRERLGYGEESYATAWGIGFPNYDINSYMDKHIQDWIDVQDVSTGRILNTAPQTFWNSYGGLLWGSAGVNLANELYRNTGDVNALRKIYPSTKSWINFMAGKVTNELFPLAASTERGMYLGDWGMPNGSMGWGNEAPAQYFNNCVFCLNLINAINTINLLQGTDGVNYAADLQLYQNMLNVLRTNIHSAFYNSTTGLYSQGTMVQQAFALLVGVVPDNCRATALEAFNKIKLQKSYLDMGSSGLPILLRYLEEENMDNDFMYKCLSSTVFPSYGYFIKGKGESCWPEFWGDNTTTSTSQSSHIHTCYTGISSWMTKCLAGINVDKNQPGMRNVIIKPYISTANGKLTSASMEQVTIYGSVRSAWTRTGQAVTLACSIPVNSSATIYLPTTDISTITENGTPISSISNITFIETKDGFSVYQVGSGEYSFGLTIPVTTALQGYNPIIIPNSAVDMSNYFKADANVVQQKVASATVGSYPYYRLSCAKGVNSVVFYVQSKESAKMDLSLWLNTFDKTNLNSIVISIYKDADLTQKATDDLTFSNFTSNTLGCSAWESPGVLKKMGNITLLTGTYFIKITITAAAIYGVHLNGLILTKTGNTALKPVLYNEIQPLKIYNIMGCLVYQGINTISKALINLPYGVYVVNGTKIINVAGKTL
jgi:alpha-L-rhamnosidase